MGDTENFGVWCGCGDSGGFVVGRDFVGRFGVDVVCISYGIGVLGLGQGSHGLGLGVIGLGESKLGLLGVAACIFADKFSILAARQSIALKTGAKVSLIQLVAGAL